MCVNIVIVMLTRNFVPIESLVVTLKIEKNWW